MKKFLALALAFCMIATSMVFVPLTVAAEDASETITVTDAESLNQAFKDIKDGGTIVIDGTITYTKESTIGTGTGKNVTITGGAIDASTVNLFHIKDNVTFDNITLTFKNLFASGYKLVINENVTASASAVFGGDCYKDCGPTEIIILAGTYTHIIGASRGGFDINGDAKVTVGGTAKVTTSVFGTGWDKSSINGNSNITICGSATVSSVFGGGPSGTVVDGDTHVIVTDSADVLGIYGGGEYGSTVTGNTLVEVNGSANKGKSNPGNDNHSGSGYKVYGGGKGAVLQNTYVSFGGNAETGYIIGGAYSTTTTTTDENNNSITVNKFGLVGGSANVHMYGGTAYHIYGCGLGNDGVAKEVNVTMTGGTVWQVFGGCESAPVEGNITIKLIGGTVKRRVFGGCYNEYDGGWKSSNSVAGTINLVLGSSGAVDFSSQESGILGSLKNDHALSAHSRRSSNDNNEHAYIIYADSGAQSKFTLKLGLVSGGTTQDAQHLYSYALNGNVITQTCSEHSTHSATATITPAGNTYTGEAINVAVEYSDNWEFEQFNVTYANNVNGGTATANLSIEGITTQTYSYDINKHSQKAPAIKIVDGKIIGLTTEMEYSTDGKTFLEVTADTVLSGKYFVRYKETASLYASPSVILYTGIDLSINNVSGRAGDTVEVIVYAPQYNGGALDLTVSYDKEALTLASATNGDVLGGFDHNGDTLTWSAASANAKKGTFVKLYFTINDGATGSYTVSVEGENITAQAGSITVVEYVCGDIAVNGEESDGKIGVDDIMALRYALVDDGTGALSAGADVNGDNVVDSRDVVILRQYIANYDFDAGESTITLGGN